MKYRYQLGGKVVKITDHAMRRIRERELDEDLVISILRSAAVLFVSGRPMKDTRIMHKGTTLVVKSEDGSSLLLLTAWKRE